MNKYLLPALLFSSALFAQDNYFSASFGVDIKNAVVGSPPTGNNQALNWTAEAHAVADNFDFCVGYESFDKIKFNRRFLSLGYHFEICYIANTDIKFGIHPSIEFSNITRGKIDNMQNEKRSYSTPSLNINWNWDLSKHFAIQIATNVLPRPDLRVIYGTKRIIVSNGIKLVYKF